MIRDRAFNSTPSGYAVPLLNQAVYQRLNGEWRIPLSTIIDQHIRVTGLLPPRLPLTYLAAISSQD